MSPDFSLAVLNPQGHDPWIDYREGPGSFRSGMHPPVNFHAFAASTRGAFCDQITQVIQEPGRFQAVLVLLRRKMAPCLEAVTRLKAAGMPVWVAWKECGPYQIADQLLTPKIWHVYRSILAQCDGILSPTLCPPPLPPGLKPPPVHYIATPYPVDLPEWDYSRPLAERAGLFLGTRECFIFARRQVAALSLAMRAAEAAQTHVTVLNTDGGKGRKLLEQIAGPAVDRLRIVEGRSPYGAYLERISAHRLVFQLDRGEVPGQVAGDVLLCRSVCVGGNSAVEQIAFPGESHPALPEREMEARLLRLLQDDVEWERTAAAAQQIARERLSFAVVARQLAGLLPSS